MKLLLIRMVLLAAAGSLALTNRVRSAEDTSETNQESRFLSRVRQLIYAGSRSGEGYFSEDGKALIFQSERQPGNPFYQIYILDLESGDSRQVSPGVGKTTCAFFRPGTDEVMFASTHLDPLARKKQQAELEFRASGRQRRYSWDYDSEMDIFCSRRDGSRVRRLTDAPGYDAEAAYSPDGQKIVFCSLRQAYPTNQLSAEDLKRLSTDPAWFGEIYIMNADGSDQRRLTEVPGYDGGPFFSPDGRHILWRRFEENGTTADVYTMNLDGSDTRRLTAFHSMSWAPYFHPSGEYVIFTSNKLGFSNFELFIVDAGGTCEPVRVTFTEGFDGLPVFSPDGRKLCWTSNRTPQEQSQLFLAEWNHEAALEALKSAPIDSRRVQDGARHAPDLRKNDPAIRQEDLHELVDSLASSAFEGRMTGTQGSRQAAEFIAARLQQSGLKPLGSNDSFFQEFSFKAGVKVISNANRLVLLRDSDPPQRRPFELATDYRPLALSANGHVEGPVAFAGYGLKLPGTDDEGYNSYAGLDVSNKIVLVLRYVPEEVSAARRQELNRYAGLRYKALLAREHGATAVLFVTGPNSPNAGELIPLRYDGSLAGSDILALTISSNVAQSLLAGTGKALQALQTALDDENPHAEHGFLLPNLRLELEVALDQIQKTDQNVLATLPSSASSSPESWILVGAHYDHLGYGEAGAMLRKGEEDMIHPGADDNASGTAVVLELAGHLAAAHRDHPDSFQHGVLFAFWSGEEIGLIGSSHFANQSPVPLSNIVAYLNFDMVGHLRENKLILQGIGSSSAWNRIVEKRNVTAGFNLALQNDPYLPTDVTSLYTKGVPAINFFTGSHEHYHRPTDRPDTLNYEGLTRIARFAASLIQDVLAAPDRMDYVEVTQSTSGGFRDTLRIYLGTIPDYTSEVEGVKLTGVRAGGPADKAGLTGGDIIVQLGGQKIANIYDYTYALDALKIGQPVPIVVEREGQKMTLEVIPEARN